MIPLKTAFDLIKNASAVIVNRHALMFHGTSELNDDPDNEFLCLIWADDEGLEYIIKAREGENQLVEVDQTDGVGTLILVDDEGEKFELTLLNQVKI